MTPTPTLAVFDCNIYVQALINPLGPAGRCIEKFRTQAIQVFVTEFILSEIEESYRKIPWKYGVTHEQTAALAHYVRLTATAISDVPSLFSYPRDPDDAHYINLALAVGARLIVSRDRDLLDLMNPVLGGSTDFHAKFPQLRILDPVAFLREIDANTPQS